MYVVYFLRIVNFFTIFNWSEMFVISIQGSNYLLVEYLKEFHNKRIKSPVKIRHNGIVT